MRAKKIENIKNEIFENGLNLNRMIKRYKMLLF